MAVLIAALIGGCWQPEEPKPAPVAALSPRIKPLALKAKDAHGLRNMRAAHMEGNWGNNVQGIRAWHPSPLVSGKPLTAASVSVSVSRSTFVDSTTGATITNDVAEVSMTDVHIGDSTRLPRAGFWLSRNVNTRATALLFFPLLDTNLAGVSGFPRNLSLTLSVDGTSGYWNDGLLATGDAAELVNAVLTQGPALLALATPYTLKSPADLDRAAASAILQNLHDQIAAQSRMYFDFLKAEHIEWLGINIAMFIDNVSDPTVRLRYRPTGNVSADIFTFDDGDLRDFIVHARSEGLRIYLVLTFEPGDINPNMPLTDPTCLQPSFVPNRWLFGAPVLFPASDGEHCIAPALWWWDPAHPQHAAKADAFWSSYQGVATKYASMAQELGVEIFSLGGETDTLFRTRPSRDWPVHYGNELRAMVAAVRTVYTGLLTYEQHFTVYTDPSSFGGDAEGNRHLYADLGLDAVGISAYFPLAPPGTRRLMTVAELEASWTSIFQSYLLPLLQANPGKPILFTEIGYPDDVGSVTGWPFTALGSSLVGADASGVTDGMRQQEHIYQAFFNVNDRFGQLVRGAFWWGNQIVTPGVDWECKSVAFNFYCKSAANTIATNYSEYELRDVDRTFDWAESRYGKYFPSHEPTATWSGYTYRYYPSSGNYLGTKDGRVILHNGGDWNLQDVGALASFVDLAAQQGF